MCYFSSERCENSPTAAQQWWSRKLLFCEAVVFGSMDFRQRNIVTYYLLFTYMLYITYVHIYIYMLYIYMYIYIYVHIYIYIYICVCDRHGPNQRPPVSSFGSSQDSCVSSKFTVTRVLVFWFPVCFCLLFGPVHCDKWYEAMAFANAHNHKTIKLGRCVQPRQKQNTFSPTEPCPPFQIRQRQVQPRKFFQFLLSACKR